MKKLRWLAVPAMAAVLFGAVSCGGGSDKTDEPVEYEDDYIDSLKLYCQETVSWASLNSKTVNITGNGTFTLEVDAENFTGSVYDGKGYFYIDQNSSKNDTTIDKAADCSSINLYVGSTDSGSAFWTEDDVDAVSVKSALYYQVYGEDEYKEFTLATPDGAEKDLCETIRNINEDDPAKDLVYGLNISYINPWATSYVDLTDFADVKIAKIKLVLTVSGITERDLTREEEEVKEDIITAEEAAWATAVILDLTSASTDANIPEDFSFEKYDSVTFEYYIDAGENTPNSAFITSKSTDTTNLWGTDDADVISKVPAASATSTTIKIPFTSETTYIGWCAYSNPQTIHITGITFNEPASWYEASEGDVTLASYSGWDATNVTWNLESTNDYAGKNVTVTVNGVGVKADEILADAAGTGDGVKVFFVDSSDRKSSGTGLGYFTSISELNDLSKTISVVTETKDVYTEVAENAEFDSETEYYTAVTENDVTTYILANDLDAFADDTTYYTKSVSTTFDASSVKAIYIENWCLAWDSNWSTTSEKVIIHSVSAEVAE